MRPNYDKDGLSESQTDERSLWRRCILSLTRKCVVMKKSKCPPAQQHSANTALQREAVYAAVLNVLKPLSVQTHQCTLITSCCFFLLQSKSPECLQPGYTFCIFTSLLIQKCSVVNMQP